LSAHHNNFFLMARPIAQTPVISGEDARRFQQSLLQSLTMSYPPDELERKKRQAQEMKRFYQEYIAVNGTF